MSLKSIITRNVISETLSKIVSLLSSASFNLSAEQITQLVNSKMGNRNVLIADNNDIGFCVSHLLNQCAFNNITSVSALEENYTSLRNEDELITETIDMMAENIAMHISPVLYELREVIPAETIELTASINEQLPAIESLYENQDTGIKIFNWGKLKNPATLSATMMVAQDKTYCFKDGVARQHDPSNVLRRVPYQSVEKLQTDSEFVSRMTTILKNTIDQNDISNSIFYPYLELALSLISNDRIFFHTIGSLKEALTGNSNLSSNIVMVVEKIDALEDILRMITVQMLDQDETSSAFAQKIFSNIETVLTNLTLIRASLIFHKIHTLQGKLILGKNIIQESAFITFQEAGGTEQMIKDHLTYMELNELQPIPNNGLSLDVVLNSSSKARSVVQKNFEKIASRNAARKVTALQNSVLAALELHYKKAIDTGIYQPTLESIHTYQVSKSISNLLKKSIDDIALEYLVTLRNNQSMTSFFKSINQELVNLVKNKTEVSQEVVQEAVCSGVVSVIFESLIKDFSSVKEAA